MSDPGKKVTSVLLVGKAITDGIGTALTITINYITRIL